MSVRRRSLLLVPAFLFLSSCAAPSSVAPEEVLRQSSLAHQTLQSAKLDIDVDFTLFSELFGGDVHGNAEIAGVMQEGGQQVDVNIHVKADGQTTEGGESSWELSAQMIVAGESETYLKLNSFTSDPPSLIAVSPLFAQLQNQWWIFPSQASPVPASPVRPDPQFLKMQSEAVRVTNDNGIVPYNGRKAHHYDVTLDHEKLMTYLENIARDSGKPFSHEETEATLKGWNATGEMWIDADTFYLLRAQWDITGTEGEHPSTVEFSVNVSDHNAHITITPPAEAQPFPIDTFLQQALPEAFIPTT